MRINAVNHTHPKYYVHLTGILFFLNMSIYLPNRRRRKYAPQGATMGALRQKLRQLLPKELQGAQAHGTWFGNIPEIQDMSPRDCTQHLL